MDNPEFGDEIGADSSESGVDGSESGTSGVSETGTSSGATSSTDSSSTEGSSSTDASSADTATDTNSGDANTSDANTSDATTDNVCPEPLIECDGVCANLDDDPLNCGACGSQCDVDNAVCLGECVPLKYVFVSSMKRNGNMGGIGGADVMCNQLADAAGLPGIYLAWNSVEVSYPNLDFDDQGIYRRTDGHIVADSYADLTDAMLAMPIDLDENQTQVLPYPVAACNNLLNPVWSNTTAMGDFATAPDCAGWTSNSAQMLGRVGRLGATDGAWSEVLECKVPCSTNLPIYCVQQTP